MKGGEAVFEALAGSQSGTWIYRRDPSSCFIVWRKCLSETGRNFWSSEKVQPVRHWWYQPTPGGCYHVIAAHNITPPSPSWHLNRTCLWKVQSEARPSRPSSISHISAVHKTFEKSVIKYFCPVADFFNDFYKCIAWKTLHFVLL